MKLTVIGAIFPGRDLQFRAKYLKQNKEIEYNWSGLENFDICFCVVFG